MLLILIEKLGAGGLEACVAANGGVVKQEG